MQVLRPANQVRSGVASMTASSVRSRSSAAASAFSNAAMYWSRSARARGAVGSAIWSATGIGLADAVRLLWLDGSASCRAAASPGALPQTKGPERFLSAPARSVWLKADHAGEDRS